MAKLAHTGLNHGNRETLPKVISCPPKLAVTIPLMIDIPLVSDHIKYLSDAFFNLFKPRHSTLSFYALLFV